MIALLTGQIHTINLKGAVILVNGVGYRVWLPLTDISRIGKPGDHITLHIHTHVREDALELFGFLDQESLSVFELVIQISGIGPKIGLAMLSGMSAKQFQSCVVSSDHVALTRIPGVGPKTAQRIVLELKDKMNRIEGIALSSNMHSSILDDLRSAISNLGYKSQQIDKAIKAVEHLAKEQKPLETLLKEALKHL